ncbi:hypothetical protein DSECCO2_655120 [anaerobic digester metagenome]
MFFRGDQPFDGSKQRVALRTLGHGHVEVADGQLAGHVRDVFFRSDERGQGAHERVRIRAGGDADLEVALGQFGDGRDHLGRGLDHGPHGLVDAFRVRGFVKLEGEVAHGHAPGDGRDLVGFAAKAPAHAAHDQPARKHREKGHGHGEPHDDQARLRIERGGFLVLRVRVAELHLRQLVDEFPGGLELVVGLALGQVHGRRGRLVRAQQALLDDLARDALPLAQGLLELAGKLFFLRRGGQGLERTEAVLGLFEVRCVGVLEGLEGLAARGCEHHGPLGHEQLVQIAVGFDQEIDARQEARKERVQVVADGACGVIARVSDRGDGDDEDGVARPEPKPQPTEQ